MTTRFCLFAIFQPSSFPIIESPTRTVVVTGEERSLGVSVSFVFRFVFEGTRDLTCLRPLIAEDTRLKI